MESSITIAKSRPILFSGPMVRAILDGGKTQTRRAIKPQPDSPPYFWKATDSNSDRPLVDANGRAMLIWPADENGGDNILKCPYGSVGTRLWVRETWFCATSEPGPTHCHYRASEDLPEFHGRWKPSIHMPRWASRITLEIESIRVERLRAISEEDANAEGFGLGATIKAERFGRYMSAGQYAFASIWETINGDGSWKGNPWVWVISFKRFPNE